MSKFCCQWCFWWFCQTELALKFPSSKTFLLIFYFIFSIILLIDSTNILATCRCIHFKTSGTFYSPNYNNVTASLSPSVDVASSSDSDSINSLSPVSLALKSSSNLLLKAHLASELSPHSSSAPESSLLSTTTNTDDASAYLSAKNLAAHQQIAIHRRLNNRCLIYKFTAPPNHIVIVTFEAFNLAPKQSRCVDFLRIYDDTVNGLINENSHYSGEYCGNQIQPETTFSSVQNYLLFHVSLTRFSKGFKGTFRFVPKDNFRSNAISNGDCHYSVNVLEGNLFSPLYPHQYPSKCDCTYELPPKVGKRLLLTLEFLKLAAVNCHRSYVDVFQLEPKILLEKFCHNFKSPYNITSTNGLLIVFHSDIKNDTNGHGYKFTFKYLPLVNGYSDELWETQTKLYRSNSSSGCEMEIQSPLLAATNGATGDMQKTTGIINSAALFQANLNSAFKCTFIFKGSPEEQVQITFLYFNLFLPPPNLQNNSERCKNVDRVSVYVRIGKGMSLIGDFCGNKLPPRIMSVRNYLEVIYEVRSATVNAAIRQTTISTASPYAFKLQYDFRTDLGLGEMNGERNTSKECYYVFRSARQKVGNIQSPNYPGLYPRMIYCHYVFYGLEKEIVIISFENFDVEGLPTCEEESSDYVLFSNYQTDDRTNRKFCGQLKPTQPIKSESNYFRMTFRSNSMFDGYGFYAHYQFINSEVSEQASEKASNGGGSMLHPFPRRLTITVLLVVFAMITPFMNH